MFLNKTEPFAARLQYSKEEEGRIIEVLFAEFLHARSQFWYILPEIELFLISQVMLFNTEHMENEISQEEIISIYQKLCQTSNRPNRTERAHMFNYIGFTIGRIKFELKCRVENAQLELRNPNPFKYTIEPNESLKRFLMWWYSQFTFMTGYFHQRMYTTTYVPWHAINLMVPSREGSMEEVKKLYKESKTFTSDNMVRQVYMKRQEIRRKAKARKENKQ